MTRPDLETIFETKMVSSWSQDYFETKMSHYLEWQDWSRDHFGDHNGLDPGLETGIGTKMSHSASGSINHSSKSFHSIWERWKPFIAWVISVKILSREIPPRFKSSMKLVFWTKDVEWVEVLKALGLLCLWQCLWLTFRNVGAKITFISANNTNEHF